MIMLATVIFAAFATDVSSGPMQVPVSDPVAVPAGIQGSIACLSYGFTGIEEGCPDLPSYPEWVSIPEGVRATGISTFEAEWRDLPGAWRIRPLPAPAILSSTQSVPSVPDPAVYGTDAFWPSEPVRLAGTGYRDDAPCAELIVTPLRYNPVTGVIDLTNNVLWGGSNTTYVPRYYAPTIAATGNGRFVVAWRQQQIESAGSRDDIFFAIVSSDGAVTRAKTRIVQDIQPQTYVYDRPNLTQLSNNRVMLTFDEWQLQTGYYYPSDIWYLWLDSDGAIVPIGDQQVVRLTSDGLTTSDTGADAVRLPDGNTIVAWTSGMYPNYRVRYASLNSVTSASMLAFASPNSMRVFSLKNSGLGMPAKPEAIERLSTKTALARSTSTIGIP